MFRHLCRPRAGWRATVEAQGLTFPTSKHEDGTESPYWFEEAMYEFSEDEIEHLETVTERLHGMCLEAARFLLTGEMGDLGLPPGALELARASMAAEQPSLYGRFDLRFDGLGPATLLEYNGDTPTGLIECSVIQWYWLMDEMPNTDQWNSLHERLVMQWKKLAPRLRSRTVHLAHDDTPGNTEEWMTVAYLRDTADQAGLTTVGLTMSDIGWDGATKQFVGIEDERIDVLFKLYPWENMLREAFGRHIMADPDVVQWIEPMWKVALSNKALLAALWHLFPDHENLLPAYLGDPGPLREWVAKPLFGREGDGIRIRTDEFTEIHDGPVRRRGLLLPEVGAAAGLRRQQGRRGLVGDRREVRRRRSPGVRRLGHRLLRAVRPAHHRLPTAQRRPEARVVGRMTEPSDAHDANAGHTCRAGAHPRGPPGPLPGVQEARLRPLAVRRLPLRRAAPRRQPATAAGDRDRRGAHRHWAGLLPHRAGEGPHRGHLVVDRHGLHRRLRRPVPGHDGRPRSSEHSSSSPCSSSPCASARRSPRD